MARTRREFIKTTAVAGAMFGAVGAPRLEAPQMGNRVPLPTPRAKALMEMFGLKYPIFSKVMRILRDTQFSGSICPDHLPSHPDDPGGFQAFAFAYGYIKALIQAVNSEV